MPNEADSYPIACLDPFEANYRAAAEQLQPDKSTRSATVAIRGGGREVVIQREPPDAPSSAEPPLREEGDIRGFSYDAKRRMRQRLAELRRDEDALFLTLTYHETNPGGREVKKDLHAFVEALRRRWEAHSWSLCWRMEYQERGVPHLHFLIWGIDFEHMDWFKKTWHRITEETSDDHRKVGAWVEKIRAGSGAKLRNYLNKYMAKEADEADGWQGRLWGFRNRKCLPTAPITRVIQIPYWLAFELVDDHLSQWGIDIDCVPYSLRIWTEDPSRWLTLYDIDSWAL